VAYPGQHQEFYPHILGMNSKRGSFVNPIMPTNLMILIGFDASGPE